MTTSEVLHQPTVQAAGMKRETEKVVAFHASSLLSLPCLNTQVICFRQEKAFSPSVCISGWSPHRSRPGFQFSPEASYGSTAPPHPGRSQVRGELFAGSPRQGKPGYTEGWVMKELWDLGLTPELLLGRMNIYAKLKKNCHLG